MITIDNFNEVKYITLFVSGSCNLHCSYCYIHKNKSLYNIDKEIRAAWESGDYLTNVNKVFNRLGVDPQKIKRVDFWGGESTIYLPSINGQLKNLFKLLPNINGIGFSTNFMTNIDSTIEFLKEVNKWCKPEFTVWLQQSIDGPDGILSENGHHGTWKVYSKNYELLSNFLNNNRLDNIKHVSINTRGTIDNKLYLDYFSDSENIYNYIKYLDETFCMLKNLFVNDKVSVGVLTPKASVPLLYTKEDAERLVKIYENWDLQLKKYEQDIGRQVSPHLRRHMYSHTRMYFNNETILRDSFSGCSKNVFDLAILPDGTLSDCTSNYMLGREDYEEYSNEKNRITSQIYKKFNFNALTSTDEELKNYIWLNTIGLKCAKSLRTTLGAGTVKELALSGQVPAKFLSDDYRIRGTKFAKYKADCLIHDVETTRIPLLTAAGTYRAHLNGFYDMVEYNQKLDRKN